MDTCILLCQCKANNFPSEKMMEITNGLGLLNVDIFELHDLCAHSINEKDFLKRIGKEYNRKIILACYPRAVKNILRQSEIDIGFTEVLNIKELSSSDIISRLESEYEIPGGEAHYHVKHSSLDVPAWFPVIDEPLCVLCGKCAEFCLFGVYRFNKKELKVVNPLACKNKCPACGRNCPSSAIIFPKLNENSALAGADPKELNASAENNSLLFKLNERNKDRRDIFRYGVLQEAEEERRKAIEEFKIKTGKEKDND